MELGNLEEAQKRIVKAVEIAPVAAVLVRQAHLAELLGKADEGIRLAQLARDKAAEMGESPQQLAWYELRLGVMRYRNGQFELAATNFEQSAELDSQQTQPLVYLSRIEAAQKRYDKAIELAEKAMKINAEPPTVALLGDLQTLTGELDKANANYAVAEQAMEDEADLLEFAHLRERALFYLNHDRKLETALELAEKDLVTRQDIYSYDTLAWALLKNDRIPEAWEAIEKAMASGTQDAEIFYHAGVIKQELGDEPTAISYLEQSMNVSPFFCPRQSNELTKRLAKMKGSTAKQQTSNIVDEAN